jgi:hypothetical protein
MTSPVCSLAESYLRAVASQDWETVSGCLASDVVRYGPFGDDFRGRTDYVAYLKRTMPSLPGYQMTIDRVSQVGDGRAMVELRETITLDSGPLVTHECLTFEIGDDGLLAEIAVYIRQAPTS